jgi:signal peptidase I
MSELDRNPSDVEAPIGEQTSMGRWLVETALLVLLAFVLAFGIRTFIAEPFIVPTGSMIPTIKINDRVLAEKITYRFIRQPRYMDIAVFPDPSGEHPHLIKRVIAVGGQTVDIKDHAVWVDGKKLDEPYTHGLPSDPGTVPLPFTVPAGYVWMMGDNRTNSGDSRYFGPVPASKLQGHAVWTYWPISSFGPLK